MGLDYLNYLSYRENVTAPLSGWHRGTAFQFDVKGHPQTPVVLTELDPDVVVVTMAVRILHSIMSLGKNILQRQKMLPGICVNKALRAVVWLCWSAVDLLLPALVTTLYIRKRRSRVKTMCDTGQPVSAVVTVKCNSGNQTETAERMIIEELYNAETEAVQEFAKMEADREEAVNKEHLLASCRNPAILSMICMPPALVDSSEESDVEDGAQEEMSLDSGLQESWTPPAKNAEDCGEESDWSDEDSWGEESDSGNEDDLWASFCRTDDPYNPFSFAMPTISPGQPKKEPPIKSPETLQTEVTAVDCGKVTKKQNLKMKPVLSGYKSSHKCSLPEEESVEEGNQRTKKVRFSPKVTVHPIITWSFAHRMARKGPWEEYARDRCRFRRRITETEAAIGFCLNAPHRERIWARLYSQQNCRPDY